MHGPCGTGRPWEDDSHKRIRAAFGTSFGIAAWTRTSGDAVAVRCSALYSSYAGGRNVCVLRITTTRPTWSRTIRNRITVSYSRFLTVHFHNYLCTVWHSLGVAFFESRSGQLARDIRDPRTPLMWHSYRYTENRRLRLRQLEAPQNIALLHGKHVARQRTGGFRECARRALPHMIPTAEETLE